MLRKLQFIFFTCQKLILAHFCKLLYKDRDLWWSNKYRVACFSQFFPAKVKKTLRKSQLQIREKLRKLSLMKKSVFLIKKMCIGRKSSAHRLVQFSYVELRIVFNFHFISSFTMTIKTSSKTTIILHSIGLSSPT